jgi:hypothetical protein
MQVYAPYRTLLLDSIINAALARAAKQNPKIKLSQARDVLRQLLYDFYWTRRFDIFIGNPWQAWAQVSHKALAAKLNLSREWVCKLIKRLREARWIETSAPHKADGKQETTTFRPGGMLRQLLSALRHSKQINRVNESSQVFPSSETDEKKQTDKPTDRPIPGDLIENLTKSMAMLPKIHW